MNAFGQTVKRFQWEGNETRLNISDVPNGTYLLSIQSTGLRPEVQKVVILRLVFAAIR